MLHGLVLVDNKCFIVLFGSIIRKWKYGIEGLVEEWQNMKRAFNQSMDKCKEMVADLFSHL